jgi:hypothetical protein
VSEDAEVAIETGYSNGKVTLRRPDGSIIVSFAVSGITPFIIPPLYKYNYNTTPTAPPSSSQVRSDTYDPLLTSALWVHRIDNENVDRKYLLLATKSGHRIYVQDTNNSDSHAVFVLTTNPIDNGSYVTFNVDVDTYSQTPLQGTGILIGIIQ